MANGVYIDNATLPECCGECFAYDENGCKFVPNIDKLHHKIWEKRAKECPLHTCRPECSLLHRVDFPSF